MTASHLAQPAERPESPIEQRLWSEFADACHRHHRDGSLASLIACLNAYCAWRRAFDDWWGGA